jgi:pimeloyl-ACP methyl ester carboxylesterase
MSYLLLLPGALGAASQLEPLAKELKPYFEAVYPLNFAGHGGKGQLTETSAFGIEAFAEEVLQWMAQEQISQAHFFGYSMGGYVALWLALNHPQRVSSILTLGTKFAWTAESAAKEVRMLDPEKIAEKVPAFARELEDRHAPNDWKLLLSRTAGMMLNLGNNPLLQHGQLAALELPVRVCVGDRDNMVTLDETAAAYRSLKNSTLAVLPATPHPIEKADLKQLVFQIKSFMVKEKHPELV